MAVKKGESRALIPDDPTPTSVGPDVAVPGDPNGVIIEPGAAPPPFIAPPPPSPWSGWPADWATAWGMGPGWPNLEELTDVAWACLDLNSSVVGTMPPYLVGAAPSLDAAWLNNPDPDRYGSWEEFFTQLFWEWQSFGEAIVYATAWYKSGWPARFHTIPPPLVDIELDAGGLRRYKVGGRDVTDRVCHIRYHASTQDVRGRSPLMVGRARLIAASLLQRYLTNLMDNGGAPTTALLHPNELTAEQSANLQTQWINARRTTMGAPAVLSGGVTFESTGVNPRDLALTELAGMTEARVAVLMRCPPFLVALPSSGDSMVYNTAALTLDFHWRAHLRPMVRRVVAALSNWLLPAGTGLEVNRDEYVKPPQLERAQTQAIYLDHKVLSVAEVRELERFGAAAPNETLTSGVLQ